MSSQESKKRESVSSLTAPAFQLPSDFEENPSRYELWTLRLPTEVKLADLDGSLLTVGEEETGTAVARFSASNEKQYQMLWGNPVENESFRLLVAQTKEAAAAAEDDSEDSDDSEKDPDGPEAQLYPSLQPFRRHLNIIESLASLEERQLAPTRDEAPAASMGLRRAYVPVPPRTNLQRRWNMPGAVTKSQAVPETITPPPLRKLSEVDSISAAVVVGHAVVARASTPTAQEHAVDDHHHHHRDDEKPPAKRKSAEAFSKEEAQSGSEHSKVSKETKRAKKDAKKEAKKAKKAKKEEKKIKKER
jgi:hypothetical protein